MTQNAMTHQYSLRGPEKAAVIIGLLGPESAGPIVEKIEDRHLRCFLTALEGMKNLPREAMLTAVAEFITSLQARKGGFRGGAEAVKGFVEALFEPSRVEFLMGGPENDRTEFSAEDVWKALKKSRISDLAQYLSQQRVEVIGVILSQLTPNEGGEILNELPEALSVATVQYMANAEAAETHLVEAIATVVQDEFLSKDKDNSANESALFIADVLGVLPAARRNKMLALLEEKDPQKAKLIAQAMITFEDLPSRLPSSAVPIIFKDYPEEILKTVLKFGETENANVVNFLYGNISQRMAGQYKEAIETLAEVSQKEGDKAISAFMSFISRLEKDNRITLIKKDD